MDVYRKQDDFDDTSNYLVLTLRSASWLRQVFIWDPDIRAFVHLGAVETEACCHPS